MKIRRIFTQIWRVNAVIILLGGLLASSVMAVSFLAILQSLWQTRRVENVVNLGSSADIKSQTELGDFERIAGSNLLRAPLYRQQTYSQDSVGRSYDKSANSIENYLFFDPLNNQTYWLKARNTALILAVTELNAATPGTNSPTPELVRPPVAFLYRVIEADTNQDQRLNEADRPSLAISDPTGRRFKVLIPQVDRFHGVSQVNNQRVAVLYSMNKRLKVAEVNLQTQIVERTTDSQSL
ncbi:MAG: hypothetical protein EA001_00750 [Oscillatoriales cyanobacterium]|nr:MAG: hypothetical protein EA001_00750 [Oscillatoriales cyanobacterium]